MTEEDYKRLQAQVDAKRIPAKDRIAPPPVEKVAKLASPKRGDKQKGEMELIIKGMFPEYKKEFVFAPNRKYRADFYIPSINTCIEYEGIMVQNGEQSRHTNIVGYTHDASKYNLMQILGYKCLRYTAKNVSEMGADLWQLKYGVNQP